MEKKDIIDVINTKYSMKEYIEFIKKIKLKYSILNKLITDLNEYKNKKYNISVTVYDKDNEIVDNLYKKINQYAEVERIKSTYDASDVNSIKYKDNFLFEIKDIKEFIIKGLDSFYDRNAEQNKDNENYIYNLKVIVTATLERFIEEIYEEKEIDALIYEQYKTDYYKLKKLYNVKDSADELYIEELVDTPQEFIQ